MRIGRKQRKKLVRKSAFRMRIAIGAPTSTKHRALKPLAQRRQGSTTIRASMRRSCASCCRSCSVARGTVHSSRPVSIPMAALPAAICSTWRIFSVWATRAVTKSAIAISDGLRDLDPLRLTASSGTSRTMVSGKEALTSPMWSVPSRKVTIRAFFAGSACSSASLAETVAGLSPPPDWNESVGRISFRPSTPLTLIDSCEVL